MAVEYSYKVIPAPDRARKIKGVRAPEARFAATLEEDFNQLASDGWEFVRTEVFSVEEKSGITGRKTVERQMMVFRRERLPAVESTAPTLTDLAPEPTMLRPAVARDAVETDNSGPRILGRPVPPIRRSTASDATPSEHD